MIDIKDAVNKYKYSLAIMTDSVDFVKSEDLDEEKLLEIRCFDESGEFHAYRSIIGVEFNCREITDGSKYADGFFDESQYLDIDETKSNGITKYTTGGGHFTMPDGINKKMLLVRYYYTFDIDGIAAKTDWRFVGFTDDETVGRGEK